MKISSNLRAGLYVAAPYAILILLLLMAAVFNTLK
jgi:hypothetical protein